MPAPPWLQDALVAVGRVGVKALRHGVREGAANAIDSVLEDFESFTTEVTRRVRAGRSALKTKPRRQRKPRKMEPEVIEAEIIEEEKE